MLSTALKQNLPENNERDLDFIHRQEDDKSLNLVLQQNKAAIQPGEGTINSIISIIENAGAAWSVQGSYRSHSTKKPPASLAPPMLLLTGLLEKWKLSRKETAILMGYDDERSLNNLLSGISNLQTRDEKDRIRHLFDIHETLFNIFKNTDDVAEWLREPSKGLDRKKPLEILLEGSMENLLLIKQFVDHLAGR